MDHREKEQQQGEQEVGAGQNPTLKEAGTAVPDYGNVMGGSSDGSVRQGGEESRHENERRSGGEDTTLVNP